jgi:hypothetical protein
MNMPLKATRLALKDINSTVNILLMLLTLGAASLAIAHGDDEQEEHQEDHNSVAISAEIANKSAIKTAIAQAGVLQDR